MSHGDLTAKDSRVAYARGWADQQNKFNSKPVVSEGYENREAGLEQGFTLAAPPSERRAGERLRLEMAISGDLTARAANGGQAVELVSKSGQTMLRYEKLEAKDVNGQMLTAKAGITGQRLWIGVADEGAVYPLTIDPTFTQQAYLKAFNTDAGDEFGQSVAVSGDTIVVVALGETSNATGVNGNQADNSALFAGAAYVSAVPPCQIACPGNQTLVTPTPNNACMKVTFTAPTTGNCIGRTVCSPPGGSCMPVGTTTVTCAATNSLNNASTCSFTITAFNVRVQDDANPSRVFLGNSLTGAYRICNCAGQTFTGTATAKHIANTFSFTQTGPDRSLTVTYDSSTFVAKASLQSPVGTTKCPLTDRDTRNDTAVCQ